MKATKKELFYNEFSNKWEGEINKKETLKRLDVVFGKLLQGINLRGLEFLEVGCGLGYFSKKAFTLGARVTGIDVGENLINKSKQKVPQGKFFVASISNLPFKDETFDMVLCTEVIEHVENQNKGFKEIYRVLKTDGLFVITTPNKIFKTLFDFLSLVGIRPYHGHEKWFYSWQFKKILTKTGWRIIKKYYFNFLYPNKLLDLFERFGILGNLMINQGYLVSKL